MELKAQNKWRWLIAAYLFLVGLAGGAYVIGVVADFLGGDWAQISKIGVSLGFPFVLVGCMFLIADLGTPTNFWRAWMRPGTACIARGTIIITIFMILGAIHIGLWIWPFRALEEAMGARQIIGVLGVVFAVSTMIYAAVLLGSYRPIDLWNTAMVPLLFLLSALSTGIMAVILIASLMGAGYAGPIASLVRINILLILVEIFVLGFCLQATHRVPESRASARLVLTGTVAPLFWLGVAILGLLIPLVSQLLGAFALEGAGAGTAALVASISGLLGGLFLRQVILSGGIQRPLRVGRFEFAVPMA
jgi:formate-dependent nitrite reductase membrane component NrfD